MESVSLTLLPLVREHYACLGRRFYQTVVDACVGKVSCQVGVSNAETDATLRSFGCTNFFVVAICGPNDLQQYTSEGLSEPLGVFCDGP